MIFFPKSFLIVVGLMVSLDLHAALTGPLTVKITDRRNRGSTFKTEGQLRPGKTGGSFELIFTDAQGQTTHRDLSGGAVALVDPMFGSKDLWAFPVTRVLDARSALYLEQLSKFADVAELADTDPYALHELIADGQKAAELAEQLTTTDPQFQRILDPDLKAPSAGDSVIERIQFGTFANTVDVILTESGFELEPVFRVRAFTREGGELETAIWSYSHPSPLVRYQASGQAIAFPKKLDAFMAGKDYQTIFSGEYYAIDFGSHLYPIQKVNPLMSGPTNYISAVPERDLRRWKKRKTKDISWAPVDLSMVVMLSRGDWTFHVKDEQFGLKKDKLAARFRKLPGRKVAKAVVAEKGRDILETMALTIAVTESYCAPSVANQGKIIKAVDAETEEGTDKAKGNGE